MAELIRCARCVVDATVPGVVFDERGVCLYCHLHDELEREWPLGEEGLRRMGEVVKAIKAEGAGRPYDCVVGVSGGTDSTYTLLTVKKLGLRPLAVYFDNGWSSDTSVKNIRESLERLQVDLDTYVVDWQEFRDLQIAFLKSGLPWADIPSDVGIISALYRAAAGQTRHIVIGQSFRTEGKMPAEWTYADDRLVRDVHRRFAGVPMSSFPNATLWEMAAYRWLRKIQLVMLLNYVPYSKTEARQILTSELGWTYYGGHHHENIFTRFVYTYWLPKKFGIEKRKITHSALVRNGELTRDQALEILQAPALSPQQEKEDLEYVISKLELTRAQFADIMEAPNRTFHDYRSYFPLLKATQGLLSLILRLTGQWTPPFFREIQIRQRMRAGGEARRETL